MAWIEFAPHNSRQLPPQHSDCENARVTRDKDVATQYHELTCSLEISRWARFTPSAIKTTALKMEIAQNTASMLMGRFASRG